MEEQFEFYNVKESPSFYSSSSKTKNGSEFDLIDEKEWIVLNEIINSPFFTGSFNGRDELVEVSASDFLLGSSNIKTSTPLTSFIEDTFIPDEIDLNVTQEELLQHRQQNYYSGYKSLILTPEFLISLDVFTKNMSWISKDIAIKCIQSSQITTSKIKSITQIIRNQCRVIANLSNSENTTPVPNFNCEVQY